MNQQQNRPCRCDDSEDPGTDAKIGIAGDRPKDYRDGDQTKQTRPFEGTTRLRIHMGISAAHRALPMFPIARGQDWDPEDVSHIERPDGDGSAWRLAGKAVVIAKRNPLWPEMVGAVNYEHGARQKLFCCILAHYFSKQLQRASRKEHLGLCLHAIEYRRKSPPLD
jgi:hypothetical protein